ncbi:TadE family protein [Kitasatospora sp. NPDC059088]|uniref:TadE family protein n=1 Tax=Kitasatospora sp. NPDC059088 TaxID=3346722 RepID=UPI0036B4327C
MKRLRRLLEQRRAQGPDDGMSSIEFVVTTPILIGLLFLAVQFALGLFAHEVALAAAQAGAREARATADANPSGWQQKAQDVAAARISSLGPSLTDNPVIKTEDIGQHQVRVTVQVDVVPVIPFLHMTLTSVSQGPVERFVPDAG